MFRSKTQFEKVLEKATSNLLLEPDFDGMLQLCDMIRGGDIKAREAVAHMKTRIREEKNPNVRYFALSVLDTAMKNCGEAVHEEVISQEFCEELQEMAKTTSAERVKGKILEMVQSWGIAFKDKPEFKVANNLYNVMKAEGYEFPPPTNTADMFKSEKAPVWKDGDECSKCKAEFGLVQRKHHCRACGGIFCNRCTSKVSIIPKFGIEKEVRVCDKCYDEINQRTSGSSDPNALPQEYLNSSLAKESQSPPARNEQALKEEEDLQIALAMSLNEQENQPRSKKQDIYATVDTSNFKPPQVKPIDDSNLDPELAKYLNRNYWERKKDTEDKSGAQQETKSDPKKKSTASAPPPETKDEPEATAPVVSEAAEPKDPPKTEEQSLQNGVDIEDNEEFMHNLRTSVEIFMNRMRSDQMRNRSIANDSAVQSLFQSINTMHPTLLQFMNDLEEKRLQYEALQDKLTQIRDARAALDALREEHKEKLRRAAEEAERLRQIQMAQKLEIMRQKKQEYLAYQRQIALQRMQEQEAARRARLEKQKQFIMQRAMQPAMIVHGYNTQYLPPQPNVGESAPDMQQPASMQTAGYPAYPGQGYPPQTVAQPTQPPYGQQIGMATPAGHYAPQQMQHPGMYQPEYPPGTGYQQGVPEPAQTAQMSGGMPPQESFSMAGMASALPQQQPQMQSQQPQVVATAPPPTPQATPNPQQMTQPASQPHMMQMGGAPPQQQQMQGQQQYYQPAQDQPPPTTQGTPVPHQEAQNLLISFD